VDVSIGIVVGVNGGALLIGEKNPRA
jgi:hypothetical protein